jgi:adenylate cyclase
MARRLAAILAADMVGYSKLMAQDEAGTLADLKKHRSDVFDPSIARYRGRIVKLMGDGVLAEFASVVDAVECAIAVQTACATPENGRIRLRMGINLGDIIIDGDDIYGDGVNVAARLETLAEPGGICISGIVHESLGNRVGARFVDAGEHRVKNLDRPIRVYRWVAEGGRPDKAGARSDGKPEKPSIAVLAFDNMSGDPEQEYFSDGIAEDIITALSHFREFFVIARNTTFTYKGQPIRVERVCGELGVRYLLEGSVRKAANRVRVTAQLIDGETGAHLWAAKYDRDLDDIFAVQDEITQAIVSAVAPETLGAELKRSQSKNAVNLNAWEKVLRARWHLSKLTREDNDIARRWLGEAVEAAPDLADAYSVLALCELHGMLHLWRTDTIAAIAAGTEAARRAVALDDNDANAHAMLGMAETFGRNYDDASRHLERAIGLNPNLANAHGVLAAVHGLSRDYASAKASADRAIALSPRDPSKTFWLGGLGIGAYIVEQYEDCLAISRQVQKEHPGYASAMRQETAALAMLGRMDEASAALERLLQRMPGLTVSQVRHMVPIRYPDDHERWLDGLRRAGLPE